MEEYFVVWRNKKKFLFGDLWSIVKKITITSTNKHIIYSICFEIEQLKIGQRPGNVSSTASPVLS